MISIEFLMTSLIVILIPGTGVIYTISSGLTGSRKTSSVAALGCTLGIVPHLVASMIGLSALLNAGSMVFGLIKMIGVVYLIYMGIGLIRSHNTFNLEDVEKEVDWRKIIGKGVLINLLNPKLTLFFFSFIPQFIVVGTGYTIQMLMLSFTFMLLTLLVFLMYGLIANGFKKMITSSEKTVDRVEKVFGVMFIALAMRLALSNN